MRRKRGTRLTGAEDKAITKRRASVLREVGAGERLVAEGPALHLMPVSENVSGQHFACVAVTDKRLLWALVEGDGSTLALRFQDVNQVLVNEQGNVRLVYHPADFPEELRRVNPAGEFDADFAFSEGQSELREAVLDAGYRGARANRDFGEVFAVAVGCVEGLLEAQVIGRSIEATAEAIVIRGAEGELLVAIPWDAGEWFRLEQGDRQYHPEVFP